MTIRTRVLLAIVATLTVLVLTGLVTVYGLGNGSLNSGVRLGTDAHNVGVEWHGYPGTFVDGN